MKNQQQLIKNLTDREIVFHLYSTQLLLLLVATVIAFVFFDDFHEFTHLWEWNIYEILVFGGIAGIIVILIDLWLMHLLPKAYFDDGGINERVFKNRSIPHIFFLCLLIAFSEEWLFRGVIQTQIGFIPASIVFALMHIRYLKKWLLLLVVILLSFLLGWLFHYTENLFVPIFTHFIIDFVFGVKIRRDALREIKG